MHVASHSDAYVVTQPFYIYKVTSNIVPLALTYYYDFSLAHSLVSEQHFFLHKNDYVRERQQTISKIRSSKSCIRWHLWKRWMSIP